MRFITLASAFEALETTSSRRKMYEVVTELFDAATDDEVRILAYLCEAQLLPSFEGVETGAGERTALAAIASASGSDLAELEPLSKKLGDLGLVAERTARRRRPSLTLDEVYTALLRIARYSGSGSAERKQAGLADCSGEPRRSKRATSCG